MNGKIIAGIIAIAAVIIIIFVINPFAKPVELPSDDENLVDDVGPGPLDVLSPEELAAYEEGLKQSDPVRYQAMQESNPAICGNEPKAEDIDWCKAAVAEKMKDDSICPALNGAARNQCYSDVARAKADKELCKSISDGGWRDECVAKVAALLQNDEICLEVQDAEISDLCIAQIAIDKNYLLGCAKIRDPDIRFDCEDYFVPAEESTE